MMKASNKIKKYGLGRVRIFYKRYFGLVEVELIEHIAKSLCLFNGNGNALAHLLVIGRPGTDVVNRLSLVPADKIELLVPAVVALANDTDLVNYFILDFRHFSVLLKLCIKKFLLQN